MTEKRKRRFGDRKDGYRLKNLADIQIIMPYALPNRTDNEAVLNESLEFEKALEFIKSKNENRQHENFKYTIFHFLTAAIAKTIYFRPKMNWFIKGHRFYERNEISFSFVVKKQFEDTSHEALAKVVAPSEGEGSLIDGIYEQVRSQVFTVRKTEKIDETTKKMGVYGKLPRWLLRFVVHCVNVFDYHGWLPTSFTKDDPYFSTVFMSNLGSIKMNANYHHLANYGTNSVFIIIGEMKKKPVFKDDGTFEMKNMVDISLTIDERIGDGVYFAKSIKLLRYIIANPQLVDLPIESPVDCDLNLYNK